MIPIKVWKFAHFGEGTGSKRSREGFTLVELLVVIAIIALLTFLAIPALSGLQGNQSQSAAADTIGDVLRQARAYAMGNNTHVFVGIAEYDVTQDPSLAPQATGVGRVVAAAVASIDGTSHYDVTTGSWTGSGTTLVPVIKPQVFNNIHLGIYAAAGDNETPPMTGTGTMKRPVFSTGYNVGDTDFTSSTPFNYPPTGAVHYAFTKVIDFDSQGVARVINFGQNNTGSIPGTIEVDLQTTHGNATPATPQDANPLNYVAVQCDGMTGAVQVYK
jgi:prepilin-type N-terminal cleavage/methylation domain-containing protein